MEQYPKHCGQVTRLPISAGEFQAMKQILIQDFSLEDSPEIWYTIASHIQAAKAWTTEMDLLELASVGRKVVINQVAQDQKLIEGAKIQAKLEEAAKKVADALKEEEAARQPKEPTRIISSLPEPDGSDLSDRTHRI